MTGAGAPLGTSIAAASPAALGEAVVGELWFAFSVPRYPALVPICAVSGLVHATRRSPQPAARRITHRMKGGAMGIRTPDPFHAMEVRYQLRYSPLPPLRVFPARRSESI